LLLVRHTDLVVISIHLMIWCWSYEWRFLPWVSSLKWKNKSDIEHKLYTRSTYDNKFVYGMWTSCLRSLMLKGHWGMSEPFCYLWEKVCIMLEEMSWMFPLINLHLLPRLRCAHGKLYLLLIYPVNGLRYISEQIRSKTARLFRVLPVYKARNQIQC